MLLISASYFLDSYVLAVFVYWFYLYLVDERHFSILKSGAVSSLPWVASLILVPLAGHLCDVLSARKGRRVGRHAGTAGGIMNTAGNLGGVASASLVPYLVEHLGWNLALETSALFGLASAALWLFIRVDESDQAAAQAVAPVPGHGRRGA